jgi:hypothetical protein
LKADLTGGWGGGFLGSSLVYQAIFLKTYFAITWQTSKYENNVNLEK